MLGIFTYLLTPWSRVLLEKLTGFQLDKKFPAFYGTQRFITAFTSARHLSLSWASSIPSIPPHPTSCRCASRINLNTSLWYQQSQNVKAEGIYSIRCSVLFKWLTDVPPHPLTLQPQHISHIAEPCETWLLRCSLPEGHVFAYQHPLLSRPLLLITSILSFLSYGGSQT